MSVFSTIGLITKPDDNRLADTVRALVSYLRPKSVDVIRRRNCSLAAWRSRILAANDVRKKAHRCDLVIVIGGDGTLLHAARSLLSSGVPLLGVNRGRLGFLVDVSPENMAYALDEVLAGRYKEDHRILLHTKVLREDETIAESTAFNDVVVHVREVIRMIELDTYVDGRYLNTQRADGLIVATPTGSTAYALSGGGPILHPNLNAIVLVPICPHTLSNRPIVVDADSQITIEVCQSNNPPARVSFDGQDNVDLLPRDRILIHRQADELRLIQPKGHDYFEILRAKLRWSEQL